MCEGLIFQNQLQHSIEITKGISQKIIIGRWQYPKKIVERKNRTLVKCVWPRCWTMKIYFMVWWLNSCTTYFLQNAIFTLAQKYTMPYETWHNVQMDARNLRIFGCPTYVHIPIELHHKSDMKSHGCIFLGYGEIESLWQNQENSHFSRRRCTSLVKWNICRPLFVVPRI